MLSAEITLQRRVTENGKAALLGLLLMYAEMTTHSSEPQRGMAYYRGEGHGFCVQAPS